MAPGFLWRAGARLLVCVAALTLAAASGGCSYSYKLGTAFGEDKPAKTASVGAGTASAAMPAPEGDLAIAKAAATELLMQDAKDASLPWQNPRTGAHGTVTAIATAYARDGATCRDFLASYVQGDKQSWYQGDACRGQDGRWEVRDLRPLQRT